jgi:superfamily I DNA/RNA helicase
MPPLDGPTLNFWKMARMLPNGWRAWISLRPNANGHDFLLLHNTDRLIFVKHITDIHQITAAADELMDIKEAVTECTVILASTVLGIKAFINASHEETPRGVTFWGSSQLKEPERLQKICSRIAPTPIPPEKIKALRARLAPEVVIPPHNASNAGRLTSQQSIEALEQIVTYTLDYPQEDILKQDLLLSDEGREAVSTPRSRLLTGVAGCGKSLVLLHRAKLLQELKSPPYRCLFITHNKLLAGELKTRYERLGKYDKKAVDIRTFASWCLQQLKVLEHEIDPKDIISWSKRQKRVEQVHRRYLDGTSISADMLREEFGWIKDNLVHELENYLKSNRTGRGFSLNESMRHRVHEAFSEYQQHLDGSNLYDWDDIPCQLWDLLQRGGKLQLYDAIFVDEAQFFPLVAFNLFKSALKPGGHFLFAADPTQGFLSRRLPWIGMGIDIRGRSHNLTVCYRTTREILEFASSFYKNRLPEYDAEVFLPEKSVLDSMIEGEPPCIQIIGAPREGRATLMKAVKKLVENEGVNAEDILILHVDGLAVQDLVQFLRNKMKNISIVDLKNQDTSTVTGVRICSLEAATGLEAPIVMVFGIDSLLQKEGDPHMSAEERNSLVRANTKRLYMAFTRAMTRLIVFLPKEYAEHSWFSAKT